MRGEPVYIPPLLIIVVEYIMITRLNLVLCNLERGYPELRDFHSHWTYKISTNLFSMVFERVGRVEARI